MSALASSRSLRNIFSIPYLRPGPVPEYRRDAAESVIQLFAFLEFRGDELYFGVHLLRRHGKLVHHVHLLADVQRRLAFRALAEIEGGLFARLMLDRGRRRIYAVLALQGDAAPPQVFG